ncbi:hypothetical protein DPEC_G00272340 [Dallia pectoralis]|uniref:Uncharacterized protein n=1 Tax=Dallia pectoralis TaxID=75939 RepID=A0ACC2FPS8_DALPE|nr:hypothetical protein DPEC_G00272340 [Dallia pectoralis]
MSENAFGEHDRLLTPPKGQMVTRIKSCGCGGVNRGKENGKMEESLLRALKDENIPSAQPLRRPEPGSFLIGKQRERTSEKVPEDTPHGAEEERLTLFLL